MTAVAKLLPCPFCGEPGEFAGCEQDGHYVRCSGRDCYGEVGENYDGCAMPSHMFSSQEDAAAAWNRRAALSPAELGGVVLFHRLHQPNYSSEWIRGDYTGPESTQRGWSVERVYSTPRAAEADWLPIESAPKDGSSFLVYLPDERRQIQVAWQNSNGVMAVGACFSFDLSPITHWHPLPAPPALTTPSAKGKKES